MVDEHVLIAGGIGLVQGGIQALSRALFAGLIPAGQVAEFFGLFNVVGKFAAVLGPGLVAVTAGVTGDPRLSLLPIAALFLGGAWLLTRVEAPAAGRAFAAYGGIYIAASLAWMWGVEGLRPDRWDALGAALCILGAGVILLAPRGA